jgi:MFS family permease
MDFTPWRTSRDFRLLTLARAIMYLGGMVSYVAVPYQLYHLTGSNTAVGLMGLIELVPLVVFGLWGGAIADHADRRTVLVATAAGQVLLTGVLLGNALLPHPAIWLLYLVAALLSVVTGLQRPSAEALLPRIVRHDELPAAVALGTFAVQISWVSGPAIGGLVIARFGLPQAFAIDVAGLAVSALLYLGLRPAPAGQDATPPSLAGIVEGLRYAVTRRDLLGTYLVDILAMVLAMSESIYPAFAQTILHRPDLLGLLYSAPTVGSLIASATSRWTARVHHHGRGVVAGATLWGAGVALAGATAPRPYLVLPSLVLAGFGDMISGLFRSIVWNQTIPDDKRGRLAGIEMLSYSIGPLAGQLRAGTTADAFGVRQAVIGGGLACVAGVAATAAALRSFWRYDARSDEHAVHERRVRAARQAAADAAPQA